MRILHTSDWHLGQKLCNLERFAEHDFFLKHLLQLIREQQVDCLLHAGDIFDTANPPNQALRQYFNFLRRLHEETNCRQAILVGGNHDSVLTLQAPQRLLEVLQVHVVGGLPADPAEQLIPIQGADGEEALVCAVPFLRDADLRNILPGESYEARQQRLREGIATHYQKLAQLAAPWKQRGQFVCATGHLFVANGQSSDSEKEIHIGLQDRFPVADFPDFFDYLALGHLHRPQRVAGMNHVRYSGSPLPLSFSERQDSKSVLLLEVEKGTLQQVRELPLPIPRRLLRLQGTVEEVCEKLQALEEPAGEFEDWMEARIQLEAPEPEIDRKLQEIAEAKPRLHLLQVRTEYIRQASGLEEQAPVQNLEDLQPREVFQELCLSHELAKDEIQRQLSTFGELLERHEEAKSQ